ncbi:MAG TPA: histidine ammonia-lyase, partial [Actinobacteria bacterium]|nr:histidine ammonia-lyase [Actinomycetota bacterium]
LIGEGEVSYQGERMTGAAVLDRLGLEPLQLEPKEGLALVNGTQALLAVGLLASERARALAKAA